MTKYFLMFCMGFVPVSAFAASACQLSFLWKFTPATPAAFIYDFLGAEFNPDPLILELETLHIKSVLGRDASERGFKPLEHKKDFHLGWLLKDKFKGSRDAIVDYFVENRTDLTFREWVESWEQSYIKAGGSLDKNWTQGRRTQGTGRDRFLLRILSEIAFKTMQDIGIRDIPVQWTSHPDLSDMYQMHMMSDPLIANGRFDEYYRKFHQRQTGVLTSRSIVPFSDEMRRIREELRDAIGQDLPLNSSQYWRHLRAIELAAEEYSRNYIFDPGYALAEILMDISLSGEDQRGTDERFWLRIRKSPTVFIAVLNQHRAKRNLEPIIIQAGAKNWADEIILQYLVSKNESAIFSYRDEDNVNYLDLKGRIFTDATFRDKVDLIFAFKQRVAWLRRSSPDLRVYFDEE
jgi:hypothetical protein